jgi:hypothetical protein
MVTTEHALVRNIHLMPIPATTGSLAGTVWLPEQPGNTRAPAVGATVTIRFADTLSFTTTTNAEGHYAFESLPPFNYLATAELTDFAPGSGMVMVHAGQAAHLDLFLANFPTMNATVEGLVLLPGPAGGPAIGATVWLFRARGDSLVTMTDDSGHFVFDSARVGLHDIHATLTGYREIHTQIMVGDFAVTHVVLHFEGEPTGGGTVNGTVVFADGTPATRAEVNLTGINNRCFFHAITDSIGFFNFEHVCTGRFHITASAMMHGFVTSEITVVENETTTVTLTLSDSANGGHHGGGGHHQGDSLTVVELTGTAIVLQDSLHPRAIRYLLDINGDGVADYRLSFGPPWYEPANVPPLGAHRPANGDTITVSGGLLTYTEPPIVVVYDINGLFWRRPFHGHGGHPGGDHHGEGCNPDSVTRIELAGVAHVMTSGGFHGERTSYQIYTGGAEDPTSTYMLDFGRPDYEPGNGAHRPANGDSITIVGGLLDCPNMRMPIVLVYEINGLAWREPGDTIALGPDASGANEPVNVGEPVSYLTARNFPNPFNPVTTIEYSIPAAGNVKVAIYDLEGRLVRELVSGFQNSGTYAVAWDATNSASGIYFYRVSVGDKSFINRMVLMK